MRTFLIIFRYTFLNRKNRRTKSRIKVGDNAIYAIFPGLIFGGIMGFLFYSFLKETNIQIPFSSIPGVTFLDIVFILWCLIMSGMFLFSYAPFISMNLFENDDIPFLLTLPVKKINIFAISSIESLVMAGIPIFMIFPIIIDYALIKNIGILFPIMSIFGFTIFLLAISNLFGMLISQFISKTSAKILTTLLYFLTMIFIVIMYNILSPKIITTEAIQAIMTKLDRWISILTAPYLFTTWVWKSAQGSIFYTLILYTVSLALIMITYLISKKLDFSISRAKKKRKTEFSVQSRGFPFLRKDLKILFRDPQSIYMILYALAFPFLMAYLNHSVFSLIMFQVMISSFYIALIPVSLLRDEKNVMPLGFNLPIDRIKIITSKIYISIILFAAIYIFSLFLGYFFLNEKPLIFLITPFIIFILCYESLYGVYYFFKNPKRETSRKMVLTTSETLLIEMSGIFMSFIIILLFSYISLIGNVSTQFNLFSNLHINRCLIHLIGGGIPLFFMLIVVWDIVRIWKRIKTAIIKWE